MEENTTGGEERGCYHRKESIPSEVEGSECENESERERETTHRKEQERKKY